VAISRAQIPEQVDIFEEGGGVGDVVSSLTPEDIIALYGAQTSAPITAADIQAQAAEMSGLFPEPKKQNIYDLASAVGAGLVGAASDPRGLGAGLTAGFQSFNERAKKIQAEKDAIKQQMTMLAYEQVQAKRKQQAETSNEVLKMQFKAALEGKGNMFSDGTTQGAALNYILSAEANPALKDTPEYKIAVALVEQKKTTFRTTETGTIPVEVPGLNIEEILGPQDTPVPPTIDIGETTWTFTQRRDQNGDPIYTDGETEKVIKPKT
tara:strand:+ start:361 stop:1158 length:798 start_codon:yes stop_codon:yes gene_type:complete